jgi:hypothetical protein
MSHHYRINGSMIQQFAGKPVSLIGTVSKVNDEQSFDDLIRRWIHSGSSIRQCDRFGNK